MATMVTRTVLGTSITAKVINKETNEITSYSTVVSKTGIETEQEATKALAKVINPELVIIKIESFAKAEKMYGMTQEAFIANAVELDPVTRKPLA